MNIFVDIDDTICFYNSKVKDLNYNNAIPNFQRIQKINDLFEQGNKITYWTARGSVTGIDWFEITQKQLETWKCKYHELRMGKPAYDLFIDDKNINSETYFENNKALKILCIIPARSGSKSLVDKNIKNFKGKPLLAWSIQHAKQSKYCEQMRIIVSTDSQEYADIAKQWGAEVPFVRPSELAGDLSTDYEFINHAVDW